MKHTFLAAALIIASSVAFADTTSVLLDRDKVRSMSAEEYAAAVRSAPDVEVRDTLGNTPLHIAAMFGTPNNIAALVSAGADVEARGSFGNTPLHFAAMIGTPDNITALLSAGADVNARNEIGTTPLHTAALLGTPDNITALLEAGASGSVKIKDGRTPFDLADGNYKIKGTAAYWALNDAQYK